MSKTSQSSTNQSKRHAVQLSWSRAKTLSEGMNRRFVDEFGQTGWCSPFVARNWLSRFKAESSMEDLAELNDYLDGNPSFSDAYGRKIYVRMQASPNGPLANIAAPTSPRKVGKKAKKPRPDVSEFSKTLGSALKERSEQAKLQSLRADTQLILNLCQLQRTYGIAEVRDALEFIATIRNY